MNDLRVCWWPIDKPTPYGRNSRKIPERAIDKVAASINEFGFRQCIVVDRDGVIICGHTRLLAAKKLGLELMALHFARPEGRQRIDLGGRGVAGHHRSPHSLSAD
jgi:ParB-like nuclease domain